MNDMTTLPAEVPSRALAPTNLLQAIVQAASDPNVDVAKMQALMAMKKELDAEEARRAFEAAMVRFKALGISVVRNKRVHFTSAKGTTDYRHATLDNVCELVGSALAGVGISHRWDTEQKEGVIRVTCVLTHELGHSTRTTLEGPPDDTGNKNSVQRIASTVTLLERYSFMAATGTASKDQDDDGRGRGASTGEEDAGDATDEDAWTKEAIAAATEASKKGHDAFKRWWLSQTVAFRDAVRLTKRYADLLAASQQ